MQIQDYVSMSSRSVKLNVIAFATLQPCDYLLCDCCAKDNKIKISEIITAALCMYINCTDSSFLNLEVVIDKTTTLCPLTHFSIHTVFTSADEVKSAVMKCRYLGRVHCQSFGRPRHGAWPARPQLQKLVLGTQNVRPSSLVLTQKYWYWTLYFKIKSPESRVNNKVLLL